MVTWGRDFPPKEIISKLQHYFLLINKISSFNSSLQSLLGDESKLAAAYVSNDHGAVSECCGGDVLH
jgi:hypothetical protein